MFDIHSYISIRYYKIHVQYHEEGMKSKQTEKFKENNIFNMEVAKFTTNVANVQ